MRKPVAARAFVGVSALLALAVALALPAGVVFAFYEAFPDEKIEPRPGAGWLDTIFANEYVVFSVRVVLISLAVVLVLGAIFVGVSIVYRMYRREFVHKLGWVEVSVMPTATEDAGALDEMNQRLLRDAWASVEAMDGLLASTAGSLEKMTRERDRLRDELARRQPFVEP